MRLISRIHHHGSEHYYTLKGHIMQAKGGHLDRVNSDQKILEMIRAGRLVLFVGGQESQN